MKPSELLRIHWSVPFDANPEMVNTRGKFLTLLEAVEKADIKGRDRCGCGAHKPSEFTAPRPHVQAILCATFALKETP